MQKRLLHIYFVVIATILMLQLTSCSQDEISIQSSSPNIQVIGRIPNYNPYYVNTKADDNGKTVEESAIKYMALLTFDTDGNLIDTQQLQGSAAIFVIDRDELKKATEVTGSDLTKSSMYLIANIDQSQAAGWHIEKIGDLQDLVYKTSLTSVGIPSTGIPMIGKIENFDLTPGVTIPGDKIQIELELLYAKIEFNLTLNATQIEPHTPKFYVRSCVAYNLPKGVHLVGNIDDDTKQTIDINNVIAEGINIPITGNRELTNMNSLAFTFYMPEHQVNPYKKGEQVYPAGISSDIEKQRYKPLLVEDGKGNYYDGKPAYVLINGIYTDHQDQEHLVTYKVYLGGNAIDDFYVKRNGRYVNDVTIKGITNSIDAAEGSVSLDHRVNVSRNDFIVFMEREAMLDSHFEVRPIRVKINPDENGDPKGTVTVKIADDCNWIRLEKSNSNNEDASKYCDNGKRKYFTKDLLADEGLKDSCIIENNTENCVWLYIDEYVEILTGLTGKTDEQIAAMVAEQQRKKRSTTITLTYTPANGGPTEVTEYQFIQRCIYPVMTTVNNPQYNRRNDDGTPYIYYIEFFEEYLHNFDSNDGFGLTDYDGISWGLEDLQISSQKQAAFIDESSKTFLLSVLDWLSIDTKDILNESIGTLETTPEYDFYLTRDKKEKGLPEEVTLRDYEGRNFTHEIMAIAKDNGKISAGTLDAEPESAAEYCYNKNKRDDNNLLSIEDMHWYMPSIDEIEDIVTSAHFDFPVFQDNYYWSSQPAYIANDFIINVELWALITTLKGSATGKYYNDHPNRARATKVEWGQTEPTKSGTNGSNGQQTYFRDWSSTEDKGYKEYSTSVTFDDGNKARTDEHRVRAVYMP